ncbi:MAG: hypothetical protein H8E34_03280 [Bacteroidetes bacterium]|nr:hypothetical protein [Bacteroidota bacterium]MBL6942958.1 hypothetical protein [Bacteroidales bacterium]
MKNLLIKVFATIFIFLFSGIISNLYSDEWIDKVVVDKKFEINENAKLIVDHEFGNVRCKNWDQNAISVKVTVKVKTDNVQKAEKIISSIIIDVKGNMDEVIARCDLNQKKFGDKSIKVTIDFDIFMPETISLDMEHKFGNAYIEHVSGPAKISSEYGSLEIVSLSNIENELELNFGEGVIKNITVGDLEISYSQFRIHKSENLTIESEYSDVNIDESKSLSIELEGGHSKIGYVEKIDARTSFSNLEIQNITESLLAVTEYGNLSIGYVDKDFSSVSITNEFGAIALNFDKGATYSFIAEGEYCSIKYPDELAKISYMNESHFSKVIKGVIGSGTTPKSSVTLKSEYGAVNITAK